MAIKIVVDSGSDLLREVAKEKGIFIVPLKVLFGEESFIDGVEIDHDGFYKKMGESSHIPVTSLPSPQDFINTFTEIGPEHEIICITISSVVSGTHQSAKIAKESLPDYRIHLVDSLNVSMAAGELALKAWEMVEKEGSTVQEILDALNEKKKHMYTFIAIDDLTNVIKGGRISNWKGNVAQFF